MTATRPSPVAATGATGSAPHDVDVEVRSAGGERPAASTSTGSEEARVEGEDEVVYDEAHAVELEKTRTGNSSSSRSAGPVWQPPQPSTPFGRLRQIIWPPVPPVGANVGPFPEGGYRAWLVVLGSFFGMGWSFGAANAFAAFQQFYTTDLLKDYSQSAIAFIGAFQYGAIYICGLTGKGFDLGLFKPVMAIAMFLYVLSWILASFCSDYWSIFLTQGLLQGLAQGLMFNYAVSCPSHWFFRRRAWALGVMAAGSSLMGTVLPIMVSNLIPRVGYAWTMRIIALSSGCIFVPSFICMRTRLPPSIDLSKGGWRKVRWIDFTVFRNVAYSIFVVSSLSIFMGFYNPFTFQTVFAEQHRIPHAQYMISIINASSMIGRVIPGYFADRIGRMNTALPMTLLAGLLIFTMPTCTTLQHLVPFSVFYGFFSGCWVSLLPAVVAQLGPTSSVGSRSGMCFAVLSIAGFTGTPVAGAILSAAPERTKWWATMGFSGAVATLGGLGLFVSRQVATKGKVFVKF